MALRSPQLFLTAARDADKGPVDDDADPLSRLAEACGPDYRTLASAAGRPDLVRRDAAQLRLLAREGGFQRMSEPRPVVYRLQAGDHVQTGVVAEVSVDDYRAGRVRRHEDTRAEREQQLSEFLAAAELELVPVTLTYQTRPRLQRLLRDAASGTPDAHVVSLDGLTQSAWVVSDAELATAIEAELGCVDALYIADGHHRMAAAARHAGRQGDGGAAAPSDFVLGALFAADEMRVLGYHRGVARPDGPSSQDLQDLIARQPPVAELEECSGAEPPRPAPGVVAVHLDGRWFRLRLRGPSGDSDARSSLDVVAVDEGIVGALLGGGAPADDAVTPLPGTTTAEQLARWCADHTAIGFLLHPPTVGQIMAVSDAGQTMPAKSTWFDPKSAAGLFLRDLAQPH